MKATLCNYVGIQTGPINELADLRASLSVQVDEWNLHETGMWGNAVLPFNKLVADLLPHFHSSAWSYYSLVVPKIQKAIGISVEHNQIEPPQSCKQRAP